MAFLRKTLPLWISLGLIALLIHRISLGDLQQAVSRLPWQLLASMTVGLVIALYLWDVLCLLTVFAGTGRPLGYGEMLRLRGRSYVAGALNQGLGQAALAWHVAQLRGTSFVAALSRSVLLGWHEGVLLAAVALAGSLGSDSPEVVRMRVVCAVILALLLGMALLCDLLPTARRRRLLNTRWGAWLDSWTWRYSLRLFVLRAVYFAIVGAYVFAALQICRVPIEPGTAVTAIPLVLMASVLPSASGLGTREAALCLLLRPAPINVLLAIGLVWSTGVIVVRLAVGLAWLWWGDCPETRFTQVSP